MSIFSISGVRDALFGWLIPDIPSIETGAELTKAATDAAIPKIYGQVKKHTGTIIFKATNDADNDSIKNDLLHIIVVWGESVQSIDKIYIDDIDIETDNSLFVVDGERYAYAINFPNGMGSYTYDKLTEAGWRSTDTCQGKACTYIRLEYGDGENQLSGEPNITADITGTSHSNPATALQDLLTNTVYGKGESTTRLNTSAFTAMAALCDTQVDEVDGQAPQRSLFTFNGAIDTSQTVLDNVNTILKPMRAAMPILNGKLTPIIERDTPAVSLEIEYDDIIEMSELVNSNKRNRFNRVVVTYQDNDANATKQEAVWPPKDSATETAWLAEDNGVLLETSIDLKGCNSYYEALAFAKTRAEVSRQQLSTSITLPIWATLFEVGDIVNVTHPTLGATAKPFRIESTNETGYEVELDLREHQPSIYDFLNTGLKPTFPDTTNVISAPAIPANLTKVDVYNELRQVDITWTGTTTNYEVQLIDDSSNVVFGEKVSRKSHPLRDLELGTYTFKVRALSSLGTPSNWASLTVIINQERNQFVWRTYAEDINGLNISVTDDANKTHIGYAYNRSKSQANATIAEQLNVDIYGFILKSTGGTAGADGKSIYTVNIHQRSAAQPSKPADNSASYNFSTGVLSLPAGWTVNVPSGSNPAWVTTTTFIITGETGTDSTCVFSDVAKLVENGADGEDGAAGSNVTATDNGNGTITIRQDGSIIGTLQNGADAPIPTYTQNGDGSVTINPNDGSGTFTVPAGDDGTTPVFGVDYFDGVTGSFFSYVYKNGTTPPATPTGGTFNGTTETYPSGTTDEPNFLSGLITYRSQTKYSPTRSGNTVTWSNNGWTAFKPHVIQGEPGTPGADAPEAVFERESGARSRSGVGTEVLYTLPSLPSGNTYRIRAEFNGGSYADDLTGPIEEPTLVERQTRVVITLYRNNVAVSGQTGTYGFALNNAYAYDIDFNTTNDGTYELRAQLSVSGAWDSATMSGTGFLQAEVV